MLARLWWKENRVFGPLWLGMLFLATGFQWWFLRVVDLENRGDFLVPMALGWAVLYAFAVGSAAFAGEREGRTMLWLDTLPVPRASLWGGKAGFAYVTSLGLALPLLAWSLIGRWGLKGSYHPVELDVIGIGSILLEAVAWSLLWSALLDHALVAAVLAILSVAVVAGVATGQVGAGADPRTLAVTAPIRLGIAALALAASWRWMTRAPRPERVHRHAFRPLAEVEPKVIGLRESPFLRHGRAIARGFRGFRSLVWQARREGRGTWLLLFNAGWLVPLVVRAYDSFLFDVGLIVSLGVLLSLAAGVSVFASENRSRVYPFYVHHGVRPGWVWLAKESVWVIRLACLAVMTTILFLAIERRGVVGGQRGFIDLIWLIAIAQFDAFAAGQFFGMVARRGITAGALALVFFLSILLPQFVVNAQLVMIPVWGLLVMPMGLLAITWTWSGDWMLDRTGAGRWLRLAAMVVLLFAGPFSVYVGSRAWGVPAVDRPFPLADVHSPEIPADRNAADFYRKMSGFSSPTPPPHEGPNLERIDKILETGWDPADRPIVDWLDRQQPLIDRIRVASRLPFARFERAEAANFFTPVDPGVNAMNGVSTLVALNLRAAESRGDLANAWEDLRVLFRMSDQLSRPPVSILTWLTAQRIRDLAVSQAIAWSFDRGQTPGLLRKALADVRSLPATHSFASVIKVEECRVENTLGLTSSEILQETSPRGPTGMSWERFERSLGFPLISAPWERERARRVIRLLCARDLHLIDGLIRGPGPDDRGREPERDEGPKKAASRPLLLPRGPGVPTLSILPRELDGYLESTPLLMFMNMNILYHADMAPRETLVGRVLEQILAIRIWKLEHGGEDPKSLAVLVPSVLDRLPIDPYSGAPLRYVRSEGQVAAPLRSLGESGQNLPRTRPGSWLLYSAGPDGDDDLGRKAYQKPYLDGDLIFPLTIHPTD